MNEQTLYDDVGRLSELFTVAVRRAAAEFGLLPTHLHVLHYLASCNRFSDTPSAVADYLGQTKGPVSQTLKVLQEKDLVAKKRDNHDRRKTHLTVTKRGHKIVNHIVEIPELRDATTHLGPTRSTEIEQALNDLISALLQAGGASSFGRCTSCQHNQKVEGKEYFCNLLQEPLTTAETHLRCREHQPA